MAYTFTAGELGIARPFGELSGLSNTALASELAAYKTAGADHLRTDIYFDVAKPTSSGAYSWTSIDRVVDAAQTAGLKVIGLLNGKPSWVNTGFTSQADKDAYGAFAGAAATHFGSRIDAWEVHNEPNLGGITAINYAGMLDKAHDAIKAASPTDTVISAGLSPIPTFGNGAPGVGTYLNALYDNGLASNSDAIGFHPYSHPLDPTLNNDAWNGWEMMETEVRGIMTAEGDSGTKIWMTEYSGGPTQGSPNPVTEANQAVYLQHAIDAAQGYTWGGPMSVYSWKDRGGGTGDAENWFGLLRPDGTQKPAFGVFQTEAQGDNPTTPPGDTPTFTGISFSGTSGADTIIGNDLDNIINGQQGNDTIKGGLGNDFLTGHEGADVLTGGAGIDTFDYNSAQSTVDTITDFTPGTDKIDLSSVDANSAVAGDQAFTFIGSSFLSGQAQVGVYQDTGSSLTYVQFSNDGDPAYENSIVLTGLKTLTAADFVL